MSIDFIDSLTFLTEDQCRVLREQDLTAPEDFAHITISRLEAAPFSLTTGKASKVLRAAKVPTSGAPVVNNSHITVTHAGAPDTATRIDKALAGARDDVASASLLVELGVALVVLAADDKIDVEATKAMRQHVAAGAPSGATWQGQRIAETATLSTPPVWCSPRTGQPLQAGKDEITDTAWGELKLDGLREAAFGYEQGMFANMPDTFVWKQMFENGLGIRDKIRTRMKALNVTPESMDRVVVFRRQAAPRGDLGHDAVGQAVPLGRVGLSSNLSSLLLRLFSGEEMRRLLRYLPDGDAIMAALPGANASPASLAMEAATYLQRHGLINRDLRDRLVAARPRWVDDIDRVFSAAGI